VEQVFPLEQFDGVNATFLLNCFGGGMECSDLGRGICWRWIAYRRAFFPISFVSVRKAEQVMQ
jgi:hypothetical protein